MPGRPVRDRGILGDGNGICFRYPAPAGRAVCGAPEKRGRMGRDIRGEKVWKSGILPADTPFG